MSCEFPSSINHQPSTINHKPSTAAEQLLTSRLAAINRTIGAFTATPWLSPQLRCQVIVIVD